MISINTGAFCTMPLTRVKSIWYYTPHLTSFINWSEANRSNHASCLNARTPSRDSMFRHQFVITAVQSLSSCTYTLTRSYATLDELIWLMISVSPTPRWSFSPPEYVPLAFLPSHCLDGLLASNRRLTWHHRCLVDGYWERWHGWVTVIISDSITPLVAYYLDGAGSAMCLPPPKNSKIKPFP